MAERKHILLVGGGFTGLTAAYELSKDPAFSVQLVESGDQLGGLAGGFPLLGTSLEKTYHHLFLTDTAIRNLVDEIGLTDQLLWCDSSMGLYLGGRTYPFMSPLDLLRFKPCGLASRLRLGLVALYLKHKGDWHRFASQNAHAWMTRACGRQVMNTIWTPLLKGKFDRYYDSVSMAWLWARIHTRANSRPPSAHKEQLGYFRGGFATVVRRLEAELARRQVRVATRTAVERFSNHRTALINGTAVPFDYCIFTGPSPVLANLLPDEVPAEYRQRLRSIAYLAAICLVFVSDQDLSDCYWLNINEPGAPFLVFLNHTRLVDKSFYQGKYVYYIGSYRPVDSPFFALSDDAIMKSWWDYLGQVFPAFNPARVTERHLFRLKSAQHIVDTTYEDRIPPYRTPVPGLFLANFSQVFPEDRGTNFAVREGLKIAELIRAEARKEATVHA